MKSLLSILFVVPTILSAQTAPAPVSTSADIIVTASALPETTTSTPASATVVTREEIEARESRDVADVLREVPGVSMARTGSPGKITTLFLRGGSSKQALVLWNGIEMNNPYFSGYNFGQMSTAGVERVEVVRGPFSALYGSEAVSGVVNVLTNPVRSDLRVDLEAGEEGLFNGAVSGAYVENDWTAHASVERRTDDGFDVNDDFTGTTIFGGAQYTPAAGFSLGLLARNNRYDLGVPRIANAAGTAFVPSPNRREEGTETQIAVPLRFERGRFVADLRLSESRRGEDYSDPEGPFGPEQSSTDSRIRQALGSVRASTPIGTITVGMESEKSVVDATSAFSVIDQEKRDSTSFFVEDRLSVPLSHGSIELAAGLRHDDYDQIGSELSPRVAAAWVSNGHKIRGAYGEAFRAPAIGELYSPFFGNPDLGAERSRNFELGYEHFAANGNFSVTAFRGEFDNLIVFGAVRFENIAQASSQGLEFSASHRFGRASVSGSYTWLDTEDEATGDPLLRRPKHSGFVAVGYDFSPVTVHLSLTHAGERDDVTDLFPYGTVRNDAYTTADLVVRYRLGNFSPYVKLENALDEEYEEVFGYASARRRAIVGVRWSLR